MDRLVAAELHITRSSFSTYRVRYLRRSEPRWASLPWSLHGRATLRVFLQQFESVGNIEHILLRVEAGLRHVLDLGSVDEERVARVFRQYVSTLPRQKTRPWELTGG